MTKHPKFTESHDSAACSVGKSISSEIRGDEPEEKCIECGHRRDYFIHSIQSGFSENVRVHGHEFRTK